MLLNVCIIFLLILDPAQSTKWLLDNPGFDSTAAWQSEFLPCALDEVIFPYNYPAVLPLPQQVDVGGFVLPHEGAILLAQDGNIELGGEVRKQRSCENGRNKRAYLQSPRQRKWYDPQNWRIAKMNNERDNYALPHMQRVPCDNEPVVITRKGPISIDLEQANYLRMGQLNLAGTIVTKEYLQYLLATDVGQLLFPNNDGVLVEYYRDGVCGCHRDLLKIQEPICHNVEESCPEPHCLNPVFPLGSCCAICGAVLQFRMARCENLKQNALQKLIAKSIAGQQLNDKLDYDVSFYSSERNGNILQIIVVDREEYRELSVDFLNRLNATTDWSKLFGSKLLFRLTHAGRPYNPHITVTSIILILLCLMFVMFAALLIFAHFAPNHAYLQHLPAWMYDPRQWRILAMHTQLIFARFDNSGTGAPMNSGAADVVETVGLGRERIALRYEVETGQVQERAFDNPMFGNKPVEQPPTLETGSLGNMAAGEEVQELTEIKLESSTDGESDAEAETKE